MSYSKYTNSVDVFWDWETGIVIKFSKMGTSAPGYTRKYHLVNTKLGSKDLQELLILKVTFYL